MSQGFEQSPGQGLGRRPVQAQMQRTSQAQAQLVELDLEDALNEEETDEPATEPPEPPELEDRGDSDAWADDATASPGFDLPVADRPAKFLGQLPRSVRLPVLFDINQDFTVCPLGGRTDECPDRRTWIASAIAEHLRQSGAVSVQPQDWVQIPAIGSNGGLLKLAKADNRADLKWALEKVGMPLKAFAVRLPNGDVLAVQVLLDAAQQGKRATRAAALRVVENRPGQLAGEVWSDADWSKFKRAQTVAKKRGGK